MHNQDMPLVIHNTRLSKVFERLVSLRLGRFKEGSGVLPTTKFPYRIELGTFDALLCVQSAKFIGEWA